MKTSVIKRLLIPGLCLCMVGAAGHGFALDKKLLVEGSVTPSVSAAPSDKMTSEFFYLTQRLKAEPASSRSRFTKTAKGGAPNGSCRLKGENLDIIETYVWLKSWDPLVRAAVEKAGAEVVDSDEGRFLLQAWVPLSRLDDVAAIPGVRQLRRPSYGVAASGSVITEGDSNLNTNFVRSIGRLSGAGIDVGVISRGLFNGKHPFTNPSEGGSNSDDRVITGNLPAYPTDPGEDGPHSGFLGNVQLFPQTLAVHDASSTEDPETGESSLENNPLPDGAAMLETIYDIAPGARLFYADGSTDVSVHSARSFLKGRGVDVIADDVIFFDTGRYDGTSAISREAQSLVLNNDIVYITAAGNFTPPVTSSSDGIGLKATRFPIFVNGHFSPRQGTSNTKFHNFAEGSNPAVRDESLTIFPQDGFIDVILVWDDNWDDTNPRATDDLDLFLLNTGSLNINSPVASSTDLQNGVGRPFERITIPIESQPYSLVIARKDVSNSAPTVFSLVILRGIIDSSDIKYLTHGVPTNNCDALPPVISVGAIDAVRGINNVSPDSVPGDTPGPGRSFANDYVKWYTTQVAPSVVSYANTDTLTSRDSSLGRFVGTSASAAHIAGLVALLRHGYRQIPSFDYYNLLRDTTVDPTLPFPTATELIADQLAIYKNAPRFFRVNGYDAYVNFSTAASVRRVTRSSYISTLADSPTWHESGPITDFQEPVFSTGSQGIAISPGGKSGVFGFWQTDILPLPDGNGGTTTKLSTDKVYALKARIGTDEPDPIKVPDFRLRMTTGGSDESALLVIAGENREAANTPNSIGGKEYTLYYKPSNDMIAQQGIRFAFDLVHFDDKDNSNATLYIQDVTFSEMDIH